MTRASDSLWSPAEREPRDRIRRPIESRWFDVFGLGVHARVGGDGAPVVLVHGYGVSGTYMLPLAQSLAPFFSVVCATQRGNRGRCSRSQRATMPFSAFARSWRRLDRRSPTGSSNACR